ncbi:MAG TPA: hypothetical protein VGN72_23010 [Tepidisphaeraceae bacterium]|jgi:hypothetical protein|nr:hypothetical protein [Tepidisphaeraceae bacterium]
MGKRLTFATGLAPVTVLFIGILGLTSGCASPASVGTHRLIEHQAMIDFSGLAPTAENRSLRVNAAIPERWESLPIHATALYTHQQWRSPGRMTGVGVAYLRMPLPLSSSAILWFAKNEYKKKKTPEGRTIGEWVDATGRHWFEGENDKYHVRGYVITKGFEAWIIYFGYRIPSIPHAAELNLAARSADKMLPTPLVSSRTPETSAASVD